METSTGEVVGRMSRDLILIQEAMGEQVGKFINLISTFLISFIVAFVKGWLLTLIMFSTIPPMVICGVIMTKVLSKVSSREQKAYTKASDIVEQTISSIRTVASFTGEKLSVQKYKKALNGVYSSNVYEGLTAGLGTGIIMFFTYSGYAFGLWNSTNLILHKGYTGGDIMSIIFIVLLSSLALGQASPCFMAFSAGQTAAYRMFEMINRTSKIDAYNSSGTKLHDIHGDIEFKEVSFSYPARPDEQIFQRFSLFIQSGTIVALVGESGSGKSTVISLIERFYDPQAGEVLIDGINIKEFQLSWLRGKIGIVSQEPVLFSSSIKDNISYGKDDATIEEIREAAGLANASKFINMMPQKMFSGASQLVNDAVKSIRTVASFSAEEKVVELYKKKCYGPTRLRIRQGVISGIGFGVSKFLFYSAYAVIFYYGATLVQNGKSDFQKVCRAFYVIVIATVGIFQTTSQCPDYSKARAATASIFALMDRVSKIDPNNEFGIKLESLRGHIRFNHVSFKYPARSDIQIFEDMCLEVQGGKTLALVGESGSGKSTAIALLQRYYDPDSGHISLDGKDLQQFQLKWLRQQMGLVSQEPILFNDTIHANIAYGAQDGKATQTEIIAAAELANAHAFICSLQQGYDTVVGEGGVQLSGGQKQRVAIARAILKKPKILLLDEATSALDAESEQVIQDALDQIMINRTTIIVTHRLTSIKKNSDIAVLKYGRIIEKGNHDMLSNIKDGVYAALITLHKNASSST